MEICLVDNTLYLLLYIHLYIPISFPSIFFSIDIYDLRAWTIIFFYFCDSCQINHAITRFRPGNPWLFFFLFDSPRLALSNSIKKIISQLNPRTYFSISIVLVGGNRSHRKYRLVIEQREFGSLLKQQDRNVSIGFETIKIDVQSVSDISIVKCNLIASSMPPRVWSYYIYRESINKATEFITASFHNRVIYREKIADGNLGHEVAHGTRIFARASGAFLLQRDGRRDNLIGIDVKRLGYPRN